jgi:sugar lactone lactonase YvrE
MLMRIRLVLLLPALLGWVVLASGVDAGPLRQPTAELIHFTDDTTAEGTPLRGEFRHHSAWCALGRGPNGKIYIAVSNHRQPGGNVLLYAYDPAAGKLKVLDDIQTVSKRADNWREDESQHKVHTFLQTHADGKVYFASMSAEPSPVVRGAHLYRIDPEDDSIEDITPTLLKGQDVADAGVLVPGKGIRGIALHPEQADHLYAMAYPGGTILRVNLKTGEREEVGRSAHDNFVMYAAADGSLYYGDQNGDGDKQSQSLKRYDPATKKTDTITDRLPPGEFGAIAPTPDGEYVVFLMAESKKVYSLDLVTRRVGYKGTLCGTNWWRVYNLHLSPDGDNAYFVSNNNENKTIRRLHLKSGHCSEQLNIDKLLGTRNLCFGGVGVWDDNGSFYAPVWTHSDEVQDLAILKATVEEPRGEAQRGD